MNAYDIVDELPEGYRWANEVECDSWIYNSDLMVQVRRGWEGHESMTDLAIRLGAIVTTRQVVVTTYEVTTDNGLN